MVCYVSKEGRRLVPKTQVESILELYHQSLLYGGHMGSQKMYHLLNKFFIWKGMRKDIEEYTKKCPVCVYDKTNYQP